MIQSWPSGITYQVFVQSFFDGNGDGIGDISGLIHKLDYFQYLGVEALWLMPIHPSPSYHKYDVQDYYGVHPDYGTLDDFRAFVQAAHGKGLKILIDLVLSHCSNQHPWFLEAQKGKDNPFRDYFVWATDEEIEALGGPEKEVSEDSDNIIQWHPVKPDPEGEKYLGFFAPNMPNLNHDNPTLRDELFTMGKFWLSEIGVDGFRLDAVKHNYSKDEEGRKEFWASFRKSMQSAAPHVYLVGEVWDHPDTIKPYLERLGSTFNFDLAQAIIEGINEGKGQHLSDKYDEIRDVYGKIEAPYIDATFLSNHDQERVMSTFEGDVRKARLAATLLFTLPGAPFIYYGEELGMLGEKPDQYIREPFPWTGDPKKKGQTDWIEKKWNLPTNTPPLSEQESHSASLLAHYRRMILIRRRSEALTYGSYERVSSKWRDLSIFVRKGSSETLLIIHNLSDMNLGMVLGPSYQDYEVHIRFSNSLTFKHNLLELPAYSSVILMKR